MKKSFFPRIVASTVLFFGIVFFLLSSSFVLAQTDLRGQISGQISAGVKSAGIPQARDPRVIAATAIEVLLSLLGMFFLVLTILGGYWYLTAKGDETKVEKAKETIKGAITGLIIVMISYSVTIFIGTKFGAAVTEGGNTTTESRLP